MLPSPRRVRTHLVAVATAATLALAGCGSSDSEDSASDGGSGGLDTVTVGISSKIAYYLPYLMEPHWHEFEKQGIDLEIEYGPAPDTLVLLTTGKIDAIVTGPSANILNAAAQETDLKLAVPGVSESAETVNGWYVSKKALDGREYSPELLEGQTLASSSGVAGPPLLSLSDELAKAGLTLADVKIQSLKQTDGMIAIENGAVFGGTLSHPNTTPVIEAGTGTWFARSAPVDFPPVSAFFGPTLLNDDPELGERFATALLNTYRTYLQGEYTTGEWADEMAEVLETDIESVKAIPADLYPTELSMPDPYFELYEKAWRQIPDVISYDEEDSPAADLIDRRFMEYANAHAD